MNLYEVRAFPKTDFGGNMAGVVLAADKMSELEMLEVAKTLGHSETAFVSLSRVADFKVRFFTPFHEVDLCGHATIATFNLMRDLKVIPLGMYTQETKAGILKIDVQENFVYMEQAKPKFFMNVDKKRIERCFKGRNFINDNYPIIIGSTGLKEIFVPITDVETLNNLRYDKNEIIELSIEYQVIGIHLFAPGDDCDAYCRNFAPIVGIDEESATGTSNGVLGAYFYNRIGKQDKYVFRQGYSMNEPSEIIVKVKGNKRVIDSVWVGGTAKQIKKPD